MALKCPYGTDIQLCITTCICMHIARAYVRICVDW